MNSPTVIDIPHSLGREEAIRRIKTRIGELPAHIPGGIAEVSHSWPAADRMALDVAAMGQRLTATLDVEDRVVRVSMVLPMMLSMMSGVIAAAVRSKGGELLLGDGSGSDTVKR